MSAADPINVRRMVMVRHTPERVAAALRDELPAVAMHLRGVDEIRLLERLDEGNGTIRAVHQWRAASTLSAMLRDHLDGDALTWIERSNWQSNPLQSSWTVESELLKGGLVGSGTTQVESAMGGRGTRLHLGISTSIAPGALGPLGIGRWKFGLEDAAAALLARILQELGSAVDSYLRNGQRS